MNKDETLQQLNHIRECQINDLRKADEMGANFLVCVGCLNAIEVLGGMRTALLGTEGHVNERLKSGLHLLGGGYEAHEKDILDLRHSMVHAYLGKTRNYTDVRIMNKNDPTLRMGLPLNLGIQIVNGRFTVNVSTWIDELETAWERVLLELMADDGKKLVSVGEALKKLPYLE